MILTEVPGVAVELWKNVDQKNLFLNYKIGFLKK